MNKPTPPPFSKPTSTRARKSAERRAAKRRAQIDAAIRLDRTAPASLSSSDATQAVGVTHEELPIPSARKVRAARARPAPRPAYRLAFYSILSALMIDVTVLISTPVLGGDWNTLRLILGSVLSLLLLERTAHWMIRTPVKFRAVFGALAFALVALFVAGAVNQVVINGKPYLASSPTAKAYRLSEGLVEDLGTLRDNDRYFNLPTEQARTYATEIVAAADSSREVADRWNPSVERDLPSPAFSDVLRNVNASADAQSQALTMLSQDLAQPDAGRQSDIALTRQSSVSSFLSATDALRATTNLYGFDITANDGPVE